MKMTVAVVLFQIDFDRFSAMALDLAGLVTADEKLELRKDDWFLNAVPILRVTVDREAIEGAGFESVVPAKPK